jgi:hypothetical protein
MASIRKRGSFAAPPKNPDGSFPKVEAGTQGTLLWGKFLGSWPWVPPGTHAAVELEDGTVIYVPLTSLKGPLNEDLVWIENLFS